MLSVQQLYTSGRNSGLAKLQEIEQYRAQLFSGDFTDNSLHYIIPVQSYTENNKIYTVHINFTPVTFVTEEEYKRVMNAGRDKFNDQWVYFIKPSNYTPVQVSCTCMNYVYTWAFYNAKTGNHFGPLPVIPPPKGLRPPRNPKHLPGMCKHIVAALNATEGFTRINLPTRY